MQTIDLHTAANLLKMHPSTVLAKARAGELPAAKPGKCWVFIAEDLISWLRGQYTMHRQEAGELNGDKTWSNYSKKPAHSIGITNSPSTAKQYIEALEQATKAPRKR